MEYFKWFKETAAPAVGEAQRELNEAQDEIREINNALVDAQAGIKQINEAELANAHAEMVQIEEALVEQNERLKKAATDCFNAIALHGEHERILGVKMAT